MFLINSLNQDEKYKFLLHLERIKLFWGNLKKYILNVTQK